MLGRRLGSSGCLHRNEIQEDRDRFVPYELLYSDSDRQTWLHYVDDFVAGFPYLVVAGRDVGEASARVRTTFPVLGDRALLDAVAQAEHPDDLLTAVRRAAVAAPSSCNAEFSAALEKGLHHPDPYVRAMTIRACAYPAWEELQAVLLRMQDEDPDERVRETAAQLLDLYGDSGT